MYLFYNKNFRLFKISKKNYIPNNISTQIDLVSFFQKVFERIPSPLKECHGIRAKVIKRFAIFRLRINNEKKKIQKKGFESKSMAMRAIVRLIICHAKINV